MSRHDELLVETIARHFPNATTSASDIALGFSGVHLDCQVNEIRDVGSQKSASLFFLLRGGPLGEVPVFASMSGYGESAESAIITGACNWASVFGPVLQTALADTPVASDSELTVFETQIDNGRYRVVLDGLDRAMTVGGDGDTETLTDDARKHLGGTPWLTPKVLSSGLLPVLPREHATVVSVFCWESSGHRTLEVKVNGVDWPDCAELMDTIPYWQGPGAALLRELAVVVPLDDGPPLTRVNIGRTLRGAERPLYGEPRTHVSWPGWQHHGGKLGEPATENEVKRLESAIGELPGDYREFLLSVQASGAGPGYGLIAPLHPAQVELAAGAFDFVDSERPETPAHGVIALAHAGCGVMWLLVVKGPQRGEVWVDAGGSDQVARCVAPSFTTWYTNWLESVVRNEAHFIQWDAACCAAPGVFSQFLDAQTQRGKTRVEAMRALAESLEPGAMSLTSGGGDYFAQGDALAPCQGCTALAERLGVGLAIFKPGAEPLQAREHKRGFVSRLLGRNW